MELRDGAWEAEYMSCLADDIMSKFNINYRAAALKTDVNKFPKDQVSICRRTRTFSANWNDPDT